MCFRLTLQQCRYVYPGATERKRHAIERGFSLTELLVVLGITALMVATAVPAFSNLMGTMRLRSASNALYFGLMLARSEAIKRNERVVVCKSATGTSCTVTGGWEQGWLVFVDTNNNSKSETGEEIVLYQPRLPSSIHINGNLPLANYVSYKGSGTTAQVSGAFQAGTITACQVSKGEVDAHKIIISAVGKARQVKDKVSIC